MNIKDMFLRLVSTSGEQTVSSTIFKHVRLVLTGGKICSFRFDNFLFQKLLYNITFYSNQSRKYLK